VSGTSSSNGRNASGSLLSHPIHRLSIPVALPQKEQGGYEDSVATGSTAQHNRGVPSSTDQRGTPTFPPEMCSTGISWAAVVMAVGLLLAGEMWIMSRLIIEDRHVPTATSM
jgi:hypothetical protein